MADLLEDIRKVFTPGVTWDLMTLHNTREVLVKCGPEIEKLLRKEVKLLKPRNASLVTCNLILAMLFVGAVCGSFMAAFLSQ